MPVNNNTLPTRPSVMAVLATGAFCITGLLLWSRDGLPNDNLQDYYASCT